MLHECYSRFGKEVTINTAQRGFTFRRIYSIGLVKDSPLQTERVSVIAFQATFVYACGSESVIDLPFGLNSLTFLFFSCSNSVTTWVKYFTMENLTC